MNSKVMGTTVIETWGECVQPERYVYYVITVVTYFWSRDTRWTLKPRVSRSALCEFYIMETRKVLSQLSIFYPCIFVSRGHRMQQEN